MKSLRQTPKIFIGTCVPAGFEQNASYCKALLTHFDSVVAENVLKFDTIQPERGRFDFSKADVLIEYAKQHFLRVRAHTMIWGSQVPSWLINGNFGREEMLHIMQGHITTVMQHYPSVMTWDVVNESIGENGALKPNVWQSQIGNDYAERAFEFARLARPDAYLFYNDGYSYVDATKVNITKDWIALGLIDGIGTQCHFKAPTGTTKLLLDNWMKDIADVGGLVEVTEMDVRLKLPFAPADLQLQADIFQMVFSVCVNNKNCTGFTVWGLNDNHSWISYAYPGYGCATLLDENYNPKPAYLACLKEGEI